MLGESLREAGYLNSLGVRVCVCVFLSVCVCVFVSFVSVLFCVCCVCFVAVFFWFLCVVVVACGPQTRIGRRCPGVQRCERAGMSINRADMQQAVNKSSTFHGSAE